jgi:hypothetical protein
MRGPSMVILAALVHAATPASASERTDLDGLRLDEVQIVGTHNSYHQAPDAVMLERLRNAEISDGPYWTGPRLARAIDYSREPLPVQLDRGIRALELDVHDDPDGILLAARPEPGFKTLHKARYDPRSSCPVFADCLAQVAGWSLANPGHVPIVLMIEVKDGGRGGGASCAGLCAEGWKRLKQALRDAFGRSLLTPGEIGGAWPTLGETRGKVIVMLLDAETHARSYRAETGRDGDDIVFTAVRPAKRAPLRANAHDRIAILPNPDDPRIADARRAGMLVYTRADADTEEARRNDGRRRDAAFASGATFISTDFPEPDPRFSDYAVRFGGEGFVRCNPNTARDRCAGKR